MIMTPDKMQEHTAKELAKRIVDNSPNYTEKMKADLKHIIDAGQSPEEILQATLSYFAVFRFY